MVNDKMKYQTFTFNPVQENTYLLWDETTLEAAIIDVGTWNRQEEQLLEGNIKAHGLKLKYALQTHGHFDHTFGLPFIYRTYGIKPIFHVDEEDTYRQMPQMAAQFGLTIVGAMPPIERLLNDGAGLSLGATAIRLIHTPGHTPGSASYYIPDAQLLLSGDTLFWQSIGRTDLPGGDMEAELDSIKNKLFRLPDDTVVLPGHGPATTIGYEKQHNYCL
ncbi:MAG: MBL fold metallo-hydrolase [Bacteroidaceae bacterium]|nr:MBL fold metallo-hydrolase [Bacteroidaceae bacterium]